MSFVETFVRRPVMALMLAALLVTLGLLAWGRLGVDLMPRVEFPVVNVNTTLRGAGPEEIEAGVTRPLEEALNTIEGIDELRSTSMESQSRITVTFLLERDADVAAQDVRDRVNTVLARLPVGTEPPVITRHNMDDIPVINLAISGERPRRVLTDIARRTVKESLETLPGVGAVDLIGGEQRAIQVRVDPDRLSARDISVSELARALAAENAETPGGRIDQGAREAWLRTPGRVESVADFPSIFVANRGGRPVLLRDLATVSDDAEDATSMALSDGRPAVSLSIRKQSGANTVAVADEVLARLERLRRGLPPDVRVEVVRDTSNFIRRSVESVEHHLLLGVAFTALTVLLFLRSWRATLVASLAIPASLVATFGIMRVFDFTLNNMTLLALSVAVGIVIDDAIVVLENILRHARKPGASALRAAIDGAGEVRLAVMATTFSLVVIFLPVAFMEGRVGRFFFSYGITLTGAVLVSLLVALTLTPPFTALILRGAREIGRSEEGRFHDTVARLYERLLRACLAHRGLVVVLGLLISATSVPLYRAIGKDFIPADDRSEFLVSFRAAEGSSLSGTAALVGELEASLKGLPGVRSLFTMIGERGDPSSGGILVQLDDIEDRELSQADIMRRARGVLKTWPTLRSSVQNIGNQGGGGFGGEVNLTLRGTDPEELEAFAAGYLERVRALPGFVDVDSSAALRRPEWIVRVDRLRAADLGVRVADIGATLRTLVGGSIVSRYRDGDDVIDVWLRLDRPFRQDPGRFGMLRVPTSTLGSSALSALGGTGSAASLRTSSVPLSSVATLEPTRGPLQIDRVDRQRQITVYSNLQGLDMGAAMSAMDQTFQAMDPPSSIDRRFYGRSKAFVDAYANFATAFALSLVFMYMILAAQFESLLLPVPILMSLPLSMPFALLSLLLLGDTLNIYSIFGLFLLVGVIKKNGILQIDRTLQLEREGLPRPEAILLANRQRLRPILMTTLTLIAGMLPIAFGQGPGSATRASMAKVILGGQGLSLLVTLLIVPVTYSLLQGAADRIRAWRAARPPAPHQARSPQSDM